MTKPIVITGVSLYGEDTADIVIAKGEIVSLSAADAPSGATKVDGSGLVALPGLVDPHTHLREPGREDAETIETGSKSAAAGGYVAVHAMANTTPVADTAGVVEQVWRRGHEVGLVDVFPLGAVTVGLQGERLAELGAMAQSKARVRMFSDDGMCVSNPVLMRRALEYVKTFDGIIAQHAQDPRLTEGSQMHEGIVSASLGLAGWPAVAEESIIARDILLAEHVGSRVHVLHLSTARSVDIVRWGKSRGVQVTAEATPHHILLTDESARNYDGRFKVNPPLRPESDVEAVRAGLVDGTIDVIGTDHAPHPDEDKDGEWASCSFGMIGLETSLGVVQKTLVDTGRLTWRDVARLMSEAPAALCQFEGHGRPLAKGEPANITLVDPKRSWVVDPREMVSRSHNSPFGGMEMPGTVVATILRGTVTHAHSALGGLGK
jgi:dihydroorotase